MSQKQCKSLEPKHKGSMLCSLPLDQDFIPSAVMSSSAKSEPNLNSMVPIV